VPITPGGVGVIDLGYIGGLASAAPDGERAAVVAGVLMFRALTYGVQIPLGAFTYVIWRGKKDWRREAPDTGSNADTAREANADADTPAGGDGGAGERAPTPAADRADRPEASPGA
jgi:hypothetical protein